MGAPVLGAMGSAASSAMGGMAGSAAGGFFGGPQGALGAAMSSGMGSIGALFSQGPSGAIASMSTAMAGATTSMTGFAAAAGAIAGPVLLAAAAFSFLSTKTKTLDGGVRLTASGMDVMLKSFEKVKKSRFWGLSTSVSETFSKMSEEQASPFIKAIDGIQNSITDAAGVLGVSAREFEKFAHQIRISTHGMSQEDASAAIMKGLQGLSDAMAEFVFSIDQTQAAFDEVALEGENATQTLLRLASSLTTVNDAMRFFGNTQMSSS